MILPAMHTGRADVHTKAMTTATCALQWLVHYLLAPVATTMWHMLWNALKRQRLFLSRSMDTA
jgi:hypothetical protein